MAKNFYSAEEAAQKLGTDEESLKKLVQEGQLREFRDAGTVNYKVTDVDALAPDDGGAGDSTMDSSMESGEIVLEPVEDSSIEFSPSGSDILSLDELDSDDTTAGTHTGVSSSSAGTLGGSSAIPSVGINVFEDDDDDEVDPLARTAVTDMAGLGLDGTGSGSGILDLTRESDDTSLGAELLEEIYTDEQEEDEETSPADDTRAGFDEAIADTDAPVETDDEDFSMEENAEPAQRMVMVETVAYAPDAVSTGLTALLVVAIVVMWFAGLAAFAAVRGVTPSLLIWIHENMAMCAGGAVLVGVFATAITFFMAKRSS